MNDKVGIVSCGVGNIGSIKQSLKISGIESDEILKPENLHNYSVAILPGVGAFDHFMHRLRDSGFENALINYRKNAENLLIGICVGMQSLCTIGYENTETKGLNIIRGQVRKIALQQKVRLPHVGWNVVKFLGDNFKSNEGNYYFTHSYQVCLESDTELLGITSYGCTITAAIKHGNTIGLQFHPEKSGKVGSQLLASIIKRPNHAEN